MVLYSFIDCGLCSLWQYNNAGIWPVLQKTLCNEIKKNDQKKTKVWQNGNVTNYWGENGKKIYVKLMQEAVLVSKRKR